MSVSIYTWWKQKKIKLSTNWEYFFWNKTKTVSTKSLQFLKRSCLKELKIIKQEMGLFEDKTFREKYLAVVGNSLHHCSTSTESGLFHPAGETHQKIYPWINTTTNALCCLRSQFFRSSNKYIPFLNNTSHLYTENNFYY